MNKILVPTDFSENSKKGIQFAINWATKQKKVELVFIHILYVLRATRWSDSYFLNYAEQKEKECREEFENFIFNEYKSMNVIPDHHSFIIIRGVSADISILDFCRTHSDIKYICISTRGAGKFNKFFGTNTGNLITKSNVPVLAVPGNYQVDSIQSVLYSSDFQNYPEEINKVVDFAGQFEASIDVIHFSWPHVEVPDDKTLQNSLKEEYKYGLNIHIEKNDAVSSLIQNLQNQIAGKEPSVVVMFTNQKRTFLEKLFLSSTAEELSFNTSVPLLVFNKHQNGL